MFDYSQSPVPIRDDIAEAHNRDLAEDCGAGQAGWRGADRLAMVAESRNARSCEFCIERKQALSPYAVEGVHKTTTQLSPAAVDTVHRITTDPSRLTRDWLEGLAEKDIDVPAYVELLGVVVAGISIDAFHRAMGLPLEPLPEPVEGESSRYRPHGAEHAGAWVPVIQPTDVSEAEMDLYDGQSRTGNVVSAMSLVPDSVRMLKTLSAAHYLEMAQVANLTAESGRALSRPQIELIAGRVSSISDCFY